MRMRSAMLGRYPANVESCIYVLSTLLSSCQCHACRRSALSVTLLAVLWKQRLDLPQQLRNGPPSCLVSRVYLEQAKGGVHTCALLAAGQTCTATWLLATRSVDARSHFENFPLPVEGKPDFPTQGQLSYLMNWPGSW